MERHVWLWLDSFSYLSTLVLVLVNVTDLHASTVDFHIHTIYTVFEMYKFYIYT